MELFMVLGYLLLIAGALWALIEAFRSGVLWGLAYIFIPFAALVWLVLHLDRGWKPTVMALFGAFMVGIGGGF